jgi:hypothetical protein
MSALDDFQHWYDAQCDDDWQHAHGIRIQTLDNPGWHVRIDLAGTRLEDLPFTPVSRGDPKEHKDPDHWIDCKVENGQFHGYSGQFQLGEILETFVAWAKSIPDWLLTPSDFAIQGRVDRTFWAALGDEVGPEICRHAGCERLRIRNSMLCRAHHFEQIKGREFIDRD